MKIERGYSIPPLRVTQSPGDGTNAHPVPMGPAYLSIVVHRERVSSDFGPCFQVLRTLISLGGRDVTMSTDRDQGERSTANKLLMSRTVNAPVGGCGAVMRSGDSGAESAVILCPLVSTRVPGRVAIPAAAGRPTSAGQWRRRIHNAADRRACSRTSPARPPAVLVCPTGMTDT